MAAFTTLASWHADSTSIPEIEDALAGVRRAEMRAAVRTSVLTLVVLTDEEDCTEILETVREMAFRHPSHAMVLVIGPETGESGCDADVEVHAIERDGASVCVEDIVLRLRGPVVRHLDSVVEPFASPDLPVAVWLPERLTAVGDPLLATADRVVVDSKELRAPEDMRDIAVLARRFPVVDLSWIRLLPWLEITAGLFEGPVFGPFVHHVQSATVWGKEGPRHLLAGWLLSRLGLDQAAVTLVDHRHAAIELLCQLPDGRAGRFRVERPDDERLIHTLVEVDGMAPLERMLRIRDRAPGRVLGTALSRLGRDRVYEEALSAAIALAGSR